MLRILVVFFILLIFSEQINASIKPKNSNTKIDSKESVKYKAMIVLTSGLVRDFACQNKKNEYICSAENVEILNGVIIKKSTYKMSEKKNVITITKSHKLDSINFIFEGYNLSKLFPQNVECIEVLQLFSENLLRKESCNLDSNIYKMNFAVDYKTFYPPFKETKNTIEALNLVYDEIFLTQNLANDYQHELQNANINLQSASLNDVLFDLYKREQRIAHDENSQNDKDYLTKDDDVLFADYKAFLQGYHDVFHNLRADSTSSNVPLQKDSNNLDMESSLDSMKEKNLDALLDALIQVATTPNTTLQIKITNPNKIKLNTEKMQDMPEPSFFIEMLNNFEVNVSLK